MVYTTCGSLRPVEPLIWLLIKILSLSLSNTVMYCKLINPCLVPARSDGPEIKTRFYCCRPWSTHMWKFEASGTLDLVAMPNFGFESLQYCNVQKMMAKNGYCEVFGITLTVHFLVLPPDVVDCGELSNPSYGHVLYHCTTSDCIANYSCTYGYKLHGGNGRVCQINGHWSGSQPWCEPAKLY